MDWQAGIWAVTLWTAGRVPTLVTFGLRQVAASLLGAMVLERWSQLTAFFPRVVVDEFAVLPDRFRALLHPPNRAELELALAWFRTTIAQEARLASLSRSGVIWEVGHEIMAVETAEELVTWRRRIRTGRALGLSGKLPEAEAAVSISGSPLAPGRSSL